MFVQKGRFWCTCVTDNVQTTEREKERNNGVLKNVRRTLVQHLYKTCTSVTHLKTEPFFKNTFIYSTYIYIFFTLVHLYNILRLAGGYQHDFVQVLNFSRIQTHKKPLLTKYALYIVRNTCTMFVQCLYKSAFFVQVSGKNRAHRIGVRS
jgi:hypothetical protein